MSAFINLSVEDLHAYLQTLAAHLEELGSLDPLERAQVISMYAKLPDGDVEEVERIRRDIRSKRPTLNMEIMARAAVARVDANVVRRPMPATGTPTPRARRRGGD